jgi:hypothetical protein
MLVSWIIELIISIIFYSRKCKLICSDIESYWWCLREGERMQAPGSEPDEDSSPDLHRMADLLAEARAAAMSLYELHPEPLRVEPLYRYLSDALTSIGDEVDKLIAQSPPSWRTSH